MSKALIIVDVQNDFTQGGALEVPDGDAVIEPLNRVAEEVDTVVATRDWHPPDHSSFEAQGGPWPEHCVQGSRGAELHSGIDRRALSDVIDKGQDRDTEGYSAFDGTDLAERLRDAGIDELYVGGLAADICVRASVLEALEAGFDVTVVEDGIRGVDVNEGDSERAIAEMRDAGARFATSDELLART